MDWTDKLENTNELIKNRHEFVGKFSMDRFVGLPELRGCDAIDQSFRNLVIIFQVDERNRIVIF